MKYIIRRGECENQVKSFPKKKEIKEIYF